MKFDPSNLDHQQELAYWDVLRGLTVNRDVEQIFSNMKAEFLQVINDPSSAAKVLLKALDGLEWDWPLWYTGDYDTLKSIKQDRLAASPRDGLKLATVTQLQALLRAHHIAAPSRKKPDAIAAVLALDKALWHGFALQQLDAEMQKRMLACKKRMAQRIPSRISITAHQRWEQYKLMGLAQTAMLKRPNLEFIASSSDPDLPGSCRKLHGRVLHWKEAEQYFPQLPCGRINCDCRFKLPNKLSGT